MTNEAAMHAHNRSTNHLPVDRRLMPIPGDPVGELSYNNMLVNQNGTVMREDQIEEIRESQGYCTTCKGTPVKLFEVRKTKLNPLWKFREPLTVPNECYKGICLKCNPNLEKAGGVLESSPTSVEIGNRSSEKNLTVTRLTDSGLSGSILEQTTESFNTSRTQNKKHDSFTSSTLRDTVRVPGNPMDYNDSFNSRRKSSNSTLGSPSEQRIDSLSLSRRNYIPMSNPAFEIKVAPTKRAPSPLKKSSPPNPAFDYNEVALKPTTSVTPKKGGSGINNRNQASIDRVRAAYERTFSQVSLDDISALTLDMDQKSSSLPEKSKSESNDCDSLMEEFSVPDFSMGTGLRPRPKQKPDAKSKNHQPTLIAGGTPSNIHPTPHSSERDRTIDKQRKATGRRASTKNLEEFSVPDVAGNTKVLKPKAKPAAQSKNYVTTRKYAPMDSSMSAIPGPSISLEQPPLPDNPLITREYRFQEVKMPAVVPAVQVTRARSLHPPPLANPSTMPPLPAFVEEDDSAGLAPPSLGSMTERESLGKEARTPAGGDSCPEALESLIDDVMAAESPDFLAELLGSTMRSHRENEAVQALCLRTIWELSKYNDENKGRIMSTGLHECIIRAMKDHPDSVDVQEPACGSLWSLSVNQFNRVVLVRSGACERILRALDAHLHHEGLVQTALGALRTLSPEPEARMVVKHMLGCQRVVRALALHRSVVNIQRDGCAFLSNVAVDVESQVVSVVPKEELQAVVRAMADHLKNESIVTSACFALKNYTYEERNIRNLRRFEDVVSLLEDAAQYATKASCRRDASEVLKRIRELRTEDDALEETAFSSLMQAMRRHNMDLNPSRQVEESVSTITDVIKEYYWSIKLICFGFESLLSLAGKSEAHMNRILSPRTLRVVIMTMKEHMACPKVQERGCQLLKFLAQVDKPENRMQICMEEGCNALVNALKQHRGYDDIQVPAYAALKALANESMCAEEIQRNGGLQIIREAEEHGMQKEEGEDFHDSGVHPLSNVSSTSAFARLPAQVSQSGKSNDRV